MGRAEVQTRRRFVVVEETGEEALAVYLDTDGDAVITQGADAFYVGKDQIKPLALFLLSEIGEIAEAVKACAPPEDPFPWEASDIDGDPIKVYEDDRGDTPAAPVLALDYGSGLGGTLRHLTPALALDLGRALLSWASSRRG